MILVRSPLPWHRSSQAITSDTVFYQRRRLLKAALTMGAGMTLFPALSCARRSVQAPSALDTTLQTDPVPSFLRHPDFKQGKQTLTPQALASSYNNFYEFGGTKQIWATAQRLPLQDWRVEVGGLVNQPRIYDLDDLHTRFPLEERIYRFRCVEAWAMVVPWLGFPMHLMLKDVDPKATARFVRFTSYYDPQVCPGPGWAFPGSLPWPYREGLYIEEMANELAFFAVGIYGRGLPKQHGAPLRMVLPWKYGFKGAKSIVKIEFLAEKPTTFWNTQSPNEYGFVANVNPQVPHPRWSQATEKVLGTGSDPYAWQSQPTLLYNGYADYVADLYQSSS